MNQASLPAPALALTCQTSETSSGLAAVSWVRLSVPAGSGPGGSAGGNSGRAVSGGAAALISLLTLVLLRLARRAAVKPVWRSYLPEVPPA